MHDLNQCYVECVEKLNKIGIHVPTEKITSVTVNTRASRKFGSTKTIKRYNYMTDRYEVSSCKIEISLSLLFDENPISELENTMLHELLHTMPDCQNHGAKWKRYAAMVNNAYGYNIERCGTTENLIVDPFAERREKYAVECQGCHKIIYRQKMSPVITNCARYRCGACGGELKRIK